MTNFLPDSSAAFYSQLLQTASKFIRLLETYGLQAARVASFEGDRNLELFITENVGEY